MALTPADDIASSAPRMIDSVADASMQWTSFYVALALVLIVIFVLFLFWRRKKILAARKKP